jgi:hypothetical protein
MATGIVARVHAMHRRRPRVVRIVAGGGCDPGPVVDKPRNLAKGVTVE